jgi:hypothetical protein
MTPPPVLLALVSSLVLQQETGAVGWGRVQFPYSPRPIFYVEAANRRLIIYHGPSRECDLVGDPAAVNQHLSELNTTQHAVVRLSSSQDISRLIDRCDRVHALLYKNDPESYFSMPVLGPQWDRSDMAVNEVVTTDSEGKSSTNSLWSINIFNRVLIFPGTKWCGQGSVAEHYSDIGYHSEADRCCR